MAKSPVEWPQWWNWELDCSNPHLVKRMTDRGFNETDLREMLENATGFEPDLAPGRWIIKTAHRGLPWEVIVEPDAPGVALVVVTAYHVG